MQAYKMVVTIDDPNRLVLTRLPFNRGQRVEVVLRDVDESALLAELRDLFTETQALPQLQTLTEDEIAVEIGAYRSGQ